jgi:hypothetical protein
MNFVDRRASYTALPITHALTHVGAVPNWDYDRRETVDELEWSSPDRASKPLYRVRQLRRYLIEGAAITLVADFDALNAALYNGRDVANTNSILSATKREELLALSTS